MVKVVAHYDNSAGNPRRPKKLGTQDVHWGEATTDEMCIGFIGVTKKGQDLTRPGEKDDLMDIFKSQIDDFQHRRQEAARKRGRPAKRGAWPDECPHGAFTSRVGLLSGGGSSV